MSDGWTPPVVITEDHSEASRMLELLASIRQPWFKDAACRGKPELFFPDRENGLTARVAKRICAACPVRRAAAKRRVA